MAWSVAFPSEMIWPDAVLQWRKTALIKLSYNIKISGVLEYQTFLFFIIFKNFSYLVINSR